MAFKRSAVYPTQIATASGYPGGKAKNKVSANDTTATPFEEQWVNDLWGFLDGLLGRGGRARSGVPDTSIASDYCFALDAICRYWVMQAFNPAPLGVQQQANQGKFRHTVPITGYNRDYWRPAVSDNRNGRLYLFQHTLAIMGSEEDHIRQMISFPVPRLKLTGMYATFENAGDMVINVSKRRRLEQPQSAFTVNNIITLNASAHSGSAVEAYQPVNGTLVQSPDGDETWEYVLTVQASSTTGTRLGNIALEFQWMPLDISYDTLLDIRSYDARNGTAPWG